jgi:deoxycytidylate deaminase
MAAIPEAPQANSLPELFFAIAGPIGVNISAISESLANALRAVRYDAHTIHLTEEMLKYELKEHEIPKPSDPNFFDEVIFKIEYANALCEEARDAATLARIGLRAIAQRRRVLADDNEKLPQTPTAYIIRQLKRPEEVALFRKVYGKQFVLVSAYGPAEQRQKLIEERIGRSLPPSVPANEVICKGGELVERDASEEDDDFGQRLRETFHLADVFIDGMSKQEMDTKLTRFVQAFFGRTDIAPSKEEYGMYAAKSASLRSSDLSRQVGAAIFSDDGELIVQGCNEVPRALGGTYWDLEQPDFRDVVIGYDPNDISKKELLRDLIDRMSKHELLSEKALELGGPGQIVEKLTKKRTSGTGEKDAPLANSDIMDLTEFGRVVHAEMSAICDAARLGRSVKNAILFCTTFPCHNCTKHIIAVGITRVIYMEPYPKSRAKDLHQNEIEIEKSTPGRVSFIPFLGISPFRYRDLFQKGKRKNPDGSAMRWIAHTERPMIDLPPPAYLDLEIAEYGHLVGGTEFNEPDLSPEKRV